MRVRRTSALWGADSDARCIGTNGLHMPHDLFATSVATSVAFAVAVAPTSTAHL